MNEAITGQPPRADCADAETLAAYVEGTLSRRLHKAVQRHLVACESCYRIVVETVRISGELRGSLASEPPLQRRPVWPPPWLKPVWQPAVAVVAIIVGLGLTLTLLWPAVHRPGPDTSLAGLVDAVGESRPIEMRPTGGFRYGPPAPVLRGTAEPDLRLRAEVARLQEIASGGGGRRSSDAVHALGVGQMLTGAIDESVATLRAARDARPGDPAIVADLGAAEAAQALEKGGDFSTALRTLDEARRLAPSLAEPSFNRALLLERLNRREEAIAAWDEYTRIDGGSPWAAEARRHRDALGGAR